MPRARRRTKRTTPAKTEAKAATRPSPIAKWTLILLVTVLVSAAAFVGIVYPRLRGPGAGRAVELVIMGDESPEALAAKLYAAGLIRLPRLFAVHAKVTALHASRGPHLLADDLSVQDLDMRLERRGAKARVTLPEGWSRFDMARRLEASHVASQKAFLDATVSKSLLDDLRIPGESAEGYLFPATYDLPMDSDPADVVRRLKSEFDKRYAALEQGHGSGLLDLSNSLGWGKREIVILASIVEKEAAVDDERPTIASVFLNRLRDPNFKRKVLQSDPTSGYGCLAAREDIPSCASFSGKITHDINVDAKNIYSTYAHEGLPPGPISNPGAKSLAAVMQPAVTPYLYFVARGEGRHTFSQTYEAHVQAIRGLRR